VDRLRNQQATRSGRRTSLQECAPRKNAFHANPSE
jgi:hypothetical protein